MPFISIRFSIATVPHAEHFVFDPLKHLVIYFAVNVAVLHLPAMQRNILQSN